jgi:hypothetical protein
MHARRDRAEQSLTPAMAPGEVAALSSAVLSPRPSPASERGRLTVLLHAAPMRTRSAVLQPADIQRLTGALAALLERVRAGSVKLVVFNVDQQKEVLRRDPFDAGDIDSVTKSLNGLQTGTVDYKALRDPKGGAALLAGILSTELRDSNERDAVVVLGPEARTHARLPEGAARRSDEGMASLLYLHFMPRSLALPPGDPWDGRAGSAGGRGGRGSGGVVGTAGGARRGNAGGPWIGGFDAPMPQDTIQRIVARLKGAVVTVRTPQDFARAVASINHR